VPKARVQRKHHVRKPHVQKPRDLRHAPKVAATVLKLPQPTPRRLGKRRSRDMRGDMPKSVSTNSRSGLLG